MGYSVHDPSQVSAAIATRLAAQTGKQFGVGVAPDDDTLPYAVVHPRGEDIDPVRFGSLDDPHAATFHEWQVTSVGSTVEQTQWMQHRVRTALLGWRPSVLGVTFGLVELTSSQAVQRDPDLIPPLFYAVDEFSCFASVQ